MLGDARVHLIHRGLSVISRPCSCLTVLISKKDVAAMIQSSRKFSRSSAFDGVISKISALTTFSATNGSLFTLL